MGSPGIQSVKIARAILADGQSIVGLNLAASDVPQVKQRLGIGTPLGEALPAEILALVEGGSLIELDNGWRLTRARIAGDKVVELVLNGIAANRESPLPPRAERTAELNEPAFVFKLKSSQQSSTARPRRSNSLVTPAKSAQTARVPLFRSSSATCRMKSGRM